MSNRANPRAPRYLKAQTRRWWTDVCANWELEEHHQRVLTAGCEAWDTMRAAGEILGREGLVVNTKSGGPRAHPAVKIAAEARLQFFRAVRELDLDLTPPVESKRGPQLRSIAGARK
jgi:P27 family predicted phage terminase small subunit